MDKKTLYQKSEKALNQAFEAAKQSAKVVSQKAGEAAHVTKLMIEKVTLEHKVSRKFAEIGNRIYEKVSRGGKKQGLLDAELGKLIEETAELDTQLGRIEATLEEERRQRKRESLKK